MPTVLSKDVNNVPLPALRLKNNCAHTIDVSSTSATNSTAFNDETRVVSLYATGPVHICFGASSSVNATSSDHYFPEGVYYDIAIGGDGTVQYSYIAAIAADYDCKLHISEKQ